MRSLFVRLMPFLACAALLFLTTPGLAATAMSAPHYDLAVTLDPGAHRLAAQATITLPPEAPRQLSLTLHAGLNPVATTPGVTLQLQGRAQGAVVLESFVLHLPPGVHRVALRYGGVIFHPLAPHGAEYGRGFHDTPGLIDPAGVFLSSEAAWYPQLPFARCTFRLRVTAPKGWQSVSQGERLAAGRGNRGVTWVEKTPQEEIYLIAGRFMLYQQAAGRVTAMAFLRQADPELAGRYLTATGHYLALYEELLGPYPYAKFALVENFWETGFGMPSFTLLGPTVIRLPFILHSSYPHEILHNWWGNGVYVAYDQGNWSEGLTAYLADHLIKEQQGQGAEYRQGVLQKYTDYAANGRDLPLARFTSRHSAATEAVGYGKGLMLFHMLRQELGDQRFVSGLKEFFHTNRFRTATFADLQTSFAKVSGQEVAPFFRQWTERTGAPRLAIRDAVVTEEKGRFRLSATLVQEQADEAYQVTVPMAMTLAGEARATVTTLPMAAKEQPFSLLLDQRPLRLDVDPEYDLFRPLARQESPPALSQLFGAHRLCIVLPEADPLLPAYRELAAALRQSGPENVDIVDAAAIDALPSDRAVLLLGWGNRFQSLMNQALAPYHAAIAPDGARFPGQIVSRQGHSVIVVAQQPGNAEQPLAWIATDLPAAVPGLGRKLPHYHKYGYLAFAGDEPVNTVKGVWPVVASPLTVQLTREPVVRGSLPARPVLVAPQPEARP